jgi:hypothetical protein
MDTRVITYKKWLTEFAYVGKGLTEGTMEDAMLHFFYEGVSPWIQGFGYSWSNEENVIARKFLRLCYAIHTTSMMDPKYTLEVPEPRHRDYQEDRDTFNYIVDTRSFIDMLDVWKFRDEIVGTRLDYLLREFCYVWINVQSGKPGAWTQAALDAESDADSEEDRANTNVLPDGNWSRRKYDLY